MDMYVFMYSPGFRVVQPLKEVKMCRESLQRAHLAEIQGGFLFV